MYNERLLASSSLAFFFWKTITCGSSTPFFSCPRFLWIFSIYILYTTFSYIYRFPNVYVHRAKASRRIGWKEKRTWQKNWAIYILYIRCVYIYDFNIYMTRVVSKNLSKIVQILGTHIILLPLWGQKGIYPQII